MIPGGRRVGAVSAGKICWKAKGPDITSTATHIRRSTSRGRPAGGAVVGAARRRAGSRRGRSRRAGFTLAELLASMGVITVLVALILPLVRRSRASAQSVGCLAQLRQIHLGFTHYAADNGERFPDPFAVSASWEQLLRRYLSPPGAFSCPADGEMYPSVGSSYDWRDTGRPETTLAGRLFTENNRGDAVLAFEALPGWHAKSLMNAVLLNGAAQSMPQDACLTDLQHPVRPFNPALQKVPKPLPDPPPKPGP